VGGAYQTSVEVYVLTFQSSTVQVSAICGQIRPDRQTLLFSATFSPSM
jgi:superfamily II DNA/RNA helicase